jgi:hypothetical protein
MKKRKLREDHESFDLNLGMLFLKKPVSADGMLDQDPLISILCNYFCFLDANTADSGRSASTRKTTTRLQVQKEEVSGRGGNRKKPKEKGAVLTFTLREQDAMDDLSILRRVCFSTCDCNCSNSL